MIDSIFSKKFMDGYDDLHKMLSDRRDSILSYRLYYQLETSSLTFHSYTKRYYPEDDSTNLLELFSRDYILERFKKFTVDDEPYKISIYVKFYLKDHVQRILIQEGEWNNKSQSPSEILSKKISPKTLIVTAGLAAIFFWLISVC